ncbi:MAG: AAA family ATPase [Actinomycetia bacterium]|nr:AAA family ATPase [Actinomycetes bacterium]MCP4225697.1 AAA family ATPase [Actinomycetes bacterium]MCP5030854.1 AAA family ATPase [Actinomycetes bacterium]
MSVADFFASSRVLIVAGKGGVGKTTVGATLGVAATRAGCEVLLIELEGHSNLAAPFGLSQLAYSTTVLEDVSGCGTLRARQITPDEALADYLETSGLRAITDRMTRTGAVDVVATTAPGIRDLVTLGKIRQLEQAKEADLIIVDAPAAGHAVTFLQAASGLAKVTPSGPVRHQADLVLDLLGDADRCQVLLVTLPEEAPVGEVVETAYSLEDRVGVKLGPIVVNSCWTPVEGLEAALAGIEADTGQKARYADDGVRCQLEQAGRYRLGRIEEQRSEIARLQAELPLATVELPFLFTTTIDRGHLDVLADALTDQLGGGRP